MPTYGCSRSSAIVSAVAAALTFGPAAGSEWSDSERRVVAALSLTRLPAVASDWRNPRAGDDAATALGAALFFDARLSGDGERSCASCHAPARAFTDGRATALGRVELDRNTPPVAGSAHLRWQGWAGRHASAVAQAAAPIESARELGGTRTGLARLIATDTTLAEVYERVDAPLVFGDVAAWPARATPAGNRRERRAWQRIPPMDRARIDGVFAVVGESLAAYVASLPLPRTRLDDYADRLAADTEPTPHDQRAMDPAARRGLALFIGPRAGCVACHSGPLLSDGRFHNIGTRTDAAGRSDSGRRAAVAALAARCDRNEAIRSADCAALAGASAAEVPALLDGAFRTPPLRQLSRTAPYMHDGRFATLEAVVEHYRAPPDKSLHRHELPPALTLDDADVVDLVAFLRLL